MERTTETNPNAFIGPLGSVGEMTSHGLRPDLNLLRETLHGLRKHQSIYSHRIGDALAAQLETYAASMKDVTDLSNEIAALRFQVGERLAAYDAALNMPYDTPDKFASRQIFIDATEGALNAAIARVQDCAVSMAKIQASKNGKLDLIVLNQIATNLSMTVDEVLRNQNGNGHDTANKIAAIIDGSFREIAGTQTNNTIASSPTIDKSRLSCDDILREMAATIPFANHDTDTDLEDVSEPTDIVIDESPAPTLAPIKFA